MGVEPAVQNYYIVYMAAHEKLGTLHARCMVEAPPIKTLEDVLAIEKRMTSERPEMHDLFIVSWRELDAST